MPEYVYHPHLAVDDVRQALPEVAAAHQAWSAKFEAYRGAFPKEAAELERLIAGKLPDDWAAELPKWKPSDKAIATRAAGGEVMNALAKRIPNLIGGSADLNPSTNTPIKGMGDFQPPESGGPAVLGAVGGEWGYGGRELAVGGREHAMGAAVHRLGAP